TVLAACSPGGAATSGPSPEGRPAVSRASAAAYTAAYPGRDRLVFRNTQVGPDFGLVSTVPLERPSSRRAISTTACDRVDATDSGVSCLRTENGATSWAWVLLTRDLRVRQQVPLSGAPSRTRLSPDGLLVASTVFVTGHAYRQTSFATATVVRRVGGPSLGNLEDFTYVRDGRSLRPRDRNVWGVTFASDDRTFYATLSTGGTAHLVRGDLRRRTLTEVRPGVECPSLSPDGRRVAFKVDVDPGRARRWQLAVLDLAAGVETRLDTGRPSVDDQAEWLDDDTLLYGLARTDAPGQTDVWSIGATRGSEPRLFLHDAWSPAVVRTTAGGAS
ncbi:MAG: hypothetical protein JWR42_1250, partial [Marmoricola sp.]|nr:hypothetical protein [Marmoricola sp.]